MVNEADGLVNISLYLSQAIDCFNIAISVRFEDGTATSKSCKLKC